MLQAQPSPMITHHSGHQEDAWRCFPLNLHQWLHITPVIKKMHDDASSSTSTNDYTSLRSSRRCMTMLQAQPSPMITHHSGHQEDAWRCFKLNLHQWLHITPVIKKMHDDASSSTSTNYYTSLRSSRRCMTMLPAQPSPMITHHSGHQEYAWRCFPHNLHQWLHITPVIKKIHDDASSSTSTNDYTSLRSSRRCMTMLQAQPSPMITHHSGHQEDAWRCFKLNLHQWLHITPVIKKMHDDASSSTSTNDYTSLQSSRRCMTMLPAQPPPMITHHSGHQEDAWRCFKLNLHQWLHITPVIKKMHDDASSSTSTNDYTSLQSSRRCMTMLQAQPPPMITHHSSHQEDAWRCFPLNLQQSLHITPVIKKMHDDASRSTSTNDYTSLRSSRRCMTMLQAQPSPMITHHSGHQEDAWRCFPRNLHQWLHITPVIKKMHDYASSSTSINDYTSLRSSRRCMTMLPAQPPPMITHHSGHQEDAWLCFKLNLHQWLHITPVIKKMHDDASRTTSTNDYTSLRSSRRCMTMLQAQPPPMITHHSGHQKDAWRCFPHNLHQWLHITPVIKKMHDDASRTTSTNDYTSLQSSRRCMTMLPAQPLPMITHHSSHQEDAWRCFKLNLHQWLHITPVIKKMHDDASSSTSTNDYTSLRSSRRCMTMLPAQPPPMERWEINPHNSWCVARVQIVPIGVWQGCKQYQLMCGKGANSNN